MAQLIARPGRNAARQAKKAKEIRHVKGAIIWHEKKRLERKQKMKDHFEEKQAKASQVQWKHEQITKVRQKALRNAAEDWKLGPLRPNRAVNVADGKYGVVTPSRIQKPEIPVKIWQKEAEAREKKGLEPAYPLVVDDKKYFPIIKGDRVVVLKGKGKGKIGIVRGIIPRTHQCIVEGVNMAYYDSAVFDTKGQDIGPRRESELPIDLDAVRLVIPYASASFSPSGQSIYEDVIVDNIVMERHTTGIDPFTGTDYGNAEFPKEHQYDPETGLPIFHRYIAGTQYRIAWPWETETKAADSTVASPNKKAAQGWLSKTMGTLRHPITTLQSWRNPTTSKKPAKRAPSTLPLSAQVDNIEASQRLKARRAVPRSDAPTTTPPMGPDDTPRYMVEGSDSMSYTLVAPPFPASLTHELRADIFDLNHKARRDPDAPHNPVRARVVSPTSAAAQAFAEKKAQAAQRMKTPLQLRWEQEQARKKQLKPAVDTETLLAALGKHMLANGGKRAVKVKEMMQ